MFLSRALDEILTDKDLSSSSQQQHGDLRRACREARDQLTVELERRRKDDADAVATDNKYVLAFLQACRMSESPRIVATALDCLQKQIAYGHLTGEAAGDSPSSSSSLSFPEDGRIPPDGSKTLMERVVEAVCGCFQGQETDENVQLQVIKALLTVVTSPRAAVHGAAMLEAVRTCYTVYMVSHSLVNQATARAALTQMVSVIFARMESQEAQESQEAKVQEQQQQNPSLVSPEEDRRSTTTSSSRSPLQTSAPEISDLASSNTSAATSPSTTAEGLPTSLASTRERSAPENAATHSGDAQTEAPRVDLADGEKEERVRWNSRFLAFVRDKEEGGGGTEAPRAREGSQSGPESDPTATARTDTEAEQVEETPQPTQIQSPHRPVPEHNAEVSGNTEDCAFVSSPCPTEMLEAEAQTHGERGLLSDAHFSHVFQKDAFLVLRTFCKLSTAPLPDAPPSSHELRSKVVSMQLLLSALQGAGPAFRAHRMFVSVIRHYLCVPLARSGVSPVTEVFHLSLAVFVALLVHFSVHLRPQIRLFIREVLLTTLETPSSSFDRKWAVIQTVRHICTNPESVWYLYASYDSEPNATPNIFGRLVNNLSKIAQGRSSGPEPGISALQELCLRKKGLECLVNVLKSMAEWSKDMYVDSAAQPNPVQEHAADAEHAEDVELEPHADHGDDIASAWDSNVSPDALVQEQDITERGIQLFNAKPAQGVWYLQDKGVLGRTAEEIARFLRCESRLDACQVGEFLGESAKLNREVMCCYVNQLDFHGQDFISALAAFLEGFGLPGDAPKIDRLVQRFAGRYLECNPGQTQFPSADSAYALAYSAVMLAADLHSAPEARSNITKEQFIKMNLGISDSKNLPREYLSSIYDEIADKNVAVKETSVTPGCFSVGVATEKRRSLLHNMEAEHVSRTAKVLAEAVSHAQPPLSATCTEQVQDMFKLVWTPSLAAFSIGLQDCDDLEVTSLCLEGIRLAVRIACVLGMSLECEAFVQALARFSLLTASSSIAEMKQKNINTIGTLLTVAYTDGNYLGNSWHEILRCISQLELTQLIGTKVQTQAGVEEGVDVGTLAGSQDKQQTTDQIQEESVEGTNSQSIVVAVDKIFTGSTRLDGDAIVNFVRLLCMVSMDELVSAQPSRMFSLQKIVEISYYNMDRVRLQWSRIWQVIGEHFSKVGCNPNEDTAIFAVVSLTQLSIKFLEKGELANFRFQKDFLKPFEHIMKENPSPKIRDMLLRCVSQIVSSQAANIQSGWKNVFSVLHQAASDQDEAVVELAFQTTSFVVSKAFQQHFEAAADSFQGGVKCLSEFLCNGAFPDSAGAKAIQLIGLCAECVSERPQFLGEYSGDGASAAPGDRVWARGWFPVLFELSRVVNRCSLEVGAAALTLMHEIVKSNGHAFEKRWWHDLFHVVFRMLDNTNLPEQQAGAMEERIHDAICDVFARFYEPLSEVLLTDVCAQLRRSVRQGNEQMARSGTSLLGKLVLLNGKRFSPEVWNVACSCMLEIVQDAGPLAGLVEERDEWTGAEMASADQKLLAGLLLKSAVQRELIRILDDVVFSASGRKEQDAGDAPASPRNNPGESEGVEGGAEPAADQGMYRHLSSLQLFQLLDCLSESQKFARDLSAAGEERGAALERQESDNAAAAANKDLLEQETSSLDCSLRILFRLYSDARHRASWPEAEARLLRLCGGALSRIARMTWEESRGGEEEEVEGEPWSRLLMLLLSGMLALPDAKFKPVISCCYDHLCRVMHLDLSPELRNALQRFFLRVGSVLHIAAPAESHTGASVPEKGVSCLIATVPEKGVPHPGATEEEKDASHLELSVPEKGVSPLELTVPEKGVSHFGLTVPEKGVSHFGATEKEEDVSQLGLTVPEKGVSPLQLTVPEKGVSPLELTVPEKGVSPLELTVPEKGVSRFGLTVPEKGVSRFGLTVPEKGVSHFGLTVPEKGVSHFGATEKEEDVSQLELTVPEKDVSQLELTVPEKDVSRLELTVPEKDVSRLELTVPEKDVSQLELTVPEKDVSQLELTVPEKDVSQLELTVPEKGVSHFGATEEEKGVSVCVERMERGDLPWHFPLFPGE